MATTFDRHEAIKELERAGASPELAEALTALLRDVRAGDLGQLVTKTDLAEFKAELFKWLIALLLGQAALIATLVKLL